MRDMKVVGVYSLKDGENVLKSRYINEYREIIEIIESISMLLWFTTYPRR